MLHNSVGAPASNTLNLQLRLTNYFQISVCDPEEFYLEDSTPEDLYFIHFYFYNC